MIINRNYERRAHERSAEGSCPWHRGRLVFRAGGARLSLDCARTGSVQRWRCRRSGGIHERVVINDEQDQPALILDAPEQYRWQEMLADLLYSPRGVALAK